MTDGAGLDIAGSLLPALAIVVGIPLGVWWWLRRGGKVGVTPGVRITAKAGLGRNTFVAVVTADERRFLVGTGENGVNLLAELEPEEPTETAQIDLDTEANRPGMGLVRRLQRHGLASQAAAQPDRPSRETIL
jgi:flagellar biogenesis protein FliO